MSMFQKNLPSHRLQNWALSDMFHSLSREDFFPKLEGERKDETKKEGKGYTRTEFSYGAFARTVPFRTEVDPEKVSAVYKNGILGVSVGKVANSSPKERKIQIKKD